MENQEVRHITENGKYRVVFEKAASANKIDGFKVEANGDDITNTFADAKTLYEVALKMVDDHKPIVTEVKK